MRLRFFRDTERGVALVVTLIMLSVVTFLAIAYLSLSRRDQSSIGNAVDQNNARLMAEAGVEHLKAKVVANILLNTNVGNYDLIVSTNFNLQDKRDFSGIVYPNRGYLTNVCLYDTNGEPVPWSIDQLRISLANLQVDPCVPVFYDVIHDRSRTNESRFFLDFNRNGIFDPTRMTNSGDTGALQVLNWGDPQWIGVLQNPNLPHSASNQFIGRFAYVGVPVGKTLDINYIHNNTKQNTQGLTQYAYQRGQGVGSWELNLAAFFRELNPLQWEEDEYVYFSATNQYNRGLTFSDALEVLNYRYDEDYDNLAAMTDNIWIPNDNAYEEWGRLLYRGENLQIDRQDVIDRFQYDLADTYSDGPLQLTAYQTGDSEADWAAKDNETENHLDDPWVGSDNPRRIFDIQELVDDSKFSSGMVERLQGIYQNKSFTDEEHYYTNDIAFYRLISQLSADSVYTADDRIPLNYTTVAVSGQTNFIPWTANRLTASNFLYLTADKLLSTYLGKNLKNVQIYPTNEYTADVHQFLQLAVNIYDAMTNQAPQSLNGPSLPAVFRPLYRVDNGRVFLDSYEIVTNDVEDWLDNDSFVRIVSRTSGGNAVVSQTDMTVEAFRGMADSKDGKVRLNVVGMPWLIGARKGYPNFNEQELLTDIQMTRKIGLNRRNTGGGIFNVQDMWVQYVLSISNRLSMEAWNSYQEDDFDFYRPLRIRMTNQLSSALWQGGRIIQVATSTNSYGMPTQYSNYVTRILSTNLTSSDIGSRWEAGRFQTVISSNLLFVPASIIETHQSGGVNYSTNAGNVTLEPKNPSTFYQGANFLANGSLYITMTNRITYIAIDQENDWLIDYVTIEKTNLFDLSDIIRGNTSTVGTTAGQGTSSVENTLWDPYYGIQRQIEISLGNVEDHNTWEEFAGNINEREYQIQGFRQFCGLTNSLSSNGIMDRQGIYRQTPYNPSVHKLIIESLQVNDPLVHYHIGDLVNFTNVYSPLRGEQAKEEEDPSNIGKLNNFYVPWGGNPDKDITGYRDSVNVVGIKDPHVTCSDDWDFPTNWYGKPFAYPTIGWLGKIHRGTPWQTVYLKSDSVAEDVWEKWSGRKASYPTNDWKLMDLFTTAINENAGKGLLSVNQTNTAAWAAVLCGINLLNTTNNTVLIEPVSDSFHQIVTNINATRAQMPNGVFSYQGQILASPALTVESPYIEDPEGSDVNDAVLEWLPMQIMSLLKEDQPAYLVYAYGQALAPAPGAIVLAPGPYRGMPTNYVVTAEYATKTVFRIENAPLNPKVVVESFDILPME